MCLKAFGFTCSDYDQSEMYKRKFEQTQQSSKVSIYSMRHFHGSSTIGLFRHFPRKHFHGAITATQSEK